MSLTIFDLDNTLLNGDSDYLWGQFLAEEGLVDAEHYERENRRYYDEYTQGRLDILEFLRFSLKPLSEHSLPKLKKLHQEFMRKKIEPLILQKALDCIENHRSKGQRLLIITATNRFITEPIAQRLGIEHLIATEPEFRNGRYTGNVAGQPSFKEGKVIRLQDWLENFDENLNDSYFYSDSHNDIPLLEQVTYPIAVDPDDALRQYARLSKWEIISFRD